MISDAELAWRLVDEVRGFLPRHKRTQVFVDIGSAEYMSAIERLLKANPARVPLRRTTLEALTEWLDRYEGFPQERRIRALIALHPCT